jgi:phosphoglucosamine mutase
VLIRYSGTEPLVRIMVEGDDEKKIREYAHDLAEALRRALGG